VFDPQLSGLLEHHPQTRRLVEAVVAAWPDHAHYAIKSFSGRDPQSMATTERIAEAALLLAGDQLAVFAKDYRWTCDRLRDEELFFHREGRYRLSTFAEANAEVYANADYMRRYMNGLLCSQVMWANHAASLQFFLDEAPRRLPPKARYLEVGPGHGLMMSMAMRDFNLAAAVAWDLSSVSIEQSRAALARLGVSNAILGVRDIMSLTDGEDTFDLVVLSEILEHLEDPHRALRHVRTLVGRDGLVFVNIPINSPSPDHIFLLETVEDARLLLTDCGFAIVSDAFFATQGVSLERALRRRYSVSACLFGRPSA
jgi:2-polyprenyl-3-methyl-5-hydroxy-6-metoxy-1,4-benzoquinol methylase